MATYYLNPTSGNDTTGDGSAGNPWKTIAKGSTSASAGDTVWLQAGDHTALTTTNDRRWTKDGTSGSRITLRGEAGAIMNGTGSSAGSNGLLFEDVVYVDVLDIEVKNYTGSGIRIDDAGSGGCNNMTVKGCWIHDCTLYGVYLRGANDCEIAYNDIHAVRIPIFETWRDTNQNYATNNNIHHNLCHDTNGTDAENEDGIASQWSDGTIVRYNLCWGCLDDGIDISAPSGLPGGADGTLPKNAIIAYNRVWDNGDAGGVGDGNGIKIDTNRGGGQTVHHNIAWANERAGFDCDKETGAGSYWYNNTSIGNGTYGFVVDYGGITDGTSALTMKNNISFGNTSGDITVSMGGDPITWGLAAEDHNIFGDTAAALTTPYPGTGTLVSTDPLLTDTTPTLDVTDAGTTAGVAAITAIWQDIWDQIEAAFLPGVGSPAINAGVAVAGINDDEGAAPDIGAVPQAAVAPTVTTATPSGVTATAATLGGNVTSDGGATVTERGVCYNTTGTPTTSDTKNTNGTGAGAFSEESTGLTPGTTYYVRAYAINSVGTSYGSEETFTASIPSSPSWSRVIYRVVGVYRDEFP